MKLNSEQFHLIHIAKTTMGYFCTFAQLYTLYKPNVGILAKGEGVLSFWCGCEERYNYLHFSKRGNDCNVESTEKPP